MTIDPANLDEQSLVARVKAVLLRPQSAFDVIAAEPAEPAVLYKSYAVPLALLSALCLTIGLIFFSWGAGGFYTRLNPVQALINGAMQFVLSIAWLYIMARAIDALAPHFGALPDRVRAHKLAVYSSTAALLAGVFSLHPWLGVFGLLGLYSLGLLYIGLPRLMKAPEEKRVGYFAAIIGVTFAAALVLFLIIGSVRSAASALVADIPALQFAQEAPVEGVAEAAAEISQLERHAQLYFNSAPPIDPERLRLALPDTLPGGFRLVSSAGEVAMGAAHATGIYTSGQARMEVMIVDLSGNGAVAALTPAADVRSNHFDASGYARTQRIDGRLYAEQVSLAEVTATYAVLGRGVALSAQGTGVTADNVRAAVETVSIQRLERQFGN